MTSLSGLWNLGREREEKEKFEAAVGFAPPLTPPVPTRSRRGGKMRSQRSYTTEKGGVCSLARAQGAWAAFVSSLRSLTHQCGGAAGGAALVGGKPKAHSLSVASPAWDGGLARFSAKGHTVSSERPRPCRLQGCCCPSTLPWGQRNSHGPHLPRRLCARNAVFTDTETWIPCHFCVLNILLLLILFQPFENGSISPGPGWLGWLQQHPTHRKAVGWTPCPSAYGRPPIDVLPTVSSINLCSVRISQNKVWQWKLHPSLTGQTKLGFPSTCWRRQQGRASAGNFLPPKDGCRTGQGSGCPGRWLLAVTRGHFQRIQRWLPSGTWNVCGDRG